MHRSEAREKTAKNKKTRGFTTLTKEARPRCKRKDKKPDKILSKEILQPITHKQTRKSIQISKLKSPATINACSHKPKPKHISRDYINNHTSNSKPHHLNSESPYVEEPVKITNSRAYSLENYYKLRAEAYSWRAKAGRQLYKPGSKATERANLQKDYTTLQALVLIGTMYITYSSYCLPLLENSLARTLCLHMLLGRGTRSLVLLNRTLVVCVPVARAHSTNL
jgi:hypothetical protein